MILKNGGSLKSAYITRRVLIYKAINFR